MYYIYHIPDFIQPDDTIGKIGVSVEPKRRTKMQGYSEYEILETHTCKYKVSEREIELQKQYGYPVDDIPYWKTIKIATTESRRKGALNIPIEDHLIEEKNYIIITIRIENLIK